MNGVDRNGLQKVPVAPRGVNINNNIRIAQQHRLTPNIMNFDPGIIGTLARAYNSAQLAWFANKVREGGEWDYKRYENFRKDKNGKPCFEDYGNFNYGATGEAMGIPEEVLLRAAGAVQILQGTSDSEWGNPFSKSPYGDDPKDQFWVGQGIKYNK